MATSSSRTSVTVLDGGHEAGVLRAPALSRSAVFLLTLSIPQQPTAGADPLLPGGVAESLRRC
jgi:hypothetical protein